jgi:hypothetical protein
MMWMVVLAAQVVAPLLDVQVDQPAVVELNGKSASTPHQFPIDVEGGSLTVIPQRELPRFLVDVPAATKKVDIVLAQERPPPGYATNKEEYDSAMAGIGWKTGIGVASGAVSVAAFATSGVLALLSNSVGVIPPLVGLGVGALGCLGSVGVCSWGVVDIISVPDEPVMRRVHVVTLTPADETQAPTSFEIDVPPPDGAGEPVTPPGGPDVHNAAFRY